MSGLNKTGANQDCKTETPTRGRMTRSPSLSLSVSLIAILAAGATGAEARTTLLQDAGQQPPAAPDAAAPATAPAEAQQPAPEGQAPAQAEAPRAPQTAVVSRITGAGRPEWAAGR